MAVVAALAVGHLVAGILVAPSASPYLAVGNAAIDRTPNAVKDFAIAQFGTSDKLVLLLGMAVVIALVAVVAGLVSRRRTLPGLIVIVVLGVVGILAVLEQAGGGVLALLAPVASLLAGAGVFWWLHRLAVRRAARQAAAVTEDSPRQPQDWRLRIHGMVERELTLSWDDLRSMRSVERPVTMTCVSNEVGGPYISTAHFTGVMLADILDAAGVRNGADQIVTTSVDGWTCGTPTETVSDPGREAMLAYAMNREPLPVEHGFPVRMIVPGLYGFVSATKWITDMKLTTFAEDRAYWLQRDWGQRAPIKTMSRIDSPGSFEQVAADRVTLAGIRVAQTVGIERVEVRLDGGQSTGGQWTPAELSTEVNIDTWRMWRMGVPGLRPGPHTADVRATDKSGYTQTPERVLSIPDGATGWHSIRFTVQ
ncbi:MAG: molybdopterin-dependent oxidoreductase [Pseudonocardiaceae bacterium]|nr:molybdopterin-dependent oxidoreductase [Pseudonocardiaceae bacterium]